LAAACFGASIAARRDTSGQIARTEESFDINAPETKEAFTDIARFFDKHLGK
jgi:hypothetical protein